METSTITDSGFIVEGEVNLTGEQVAGRDIYNTENYYASEIPGGFAEINISAYDDNFYTSPVFTGALAEQIKDRRLLVIAGGTGFDKNALARHLACYISKDYSGIRVVEWRDPEDAANILKEIKEESRPAIFILPDTVPQHIQYDLQKLASVAKDHSHYIIITTEMTVDTWQQQQAVLDLYWFEVPLSGIYSKESLTAFFLQKLDLNRKLFDIPPGAELHEHYDIGKKYTPQKIASLFDTPDQIVFFLTLLETTAGENLVESIQSSIATVTDKSETLVTKWYRTLSPSQKLIALGAALLEGMYDDQYFAVMQQVITDFWHYRDGNLQSLDYCDLDFLLNFFKFEAYDDGRIMLGGKFPDQRAEIIRAAWSGHKRHILSAFNVITTLAGSSSAASAKKITNAEINGTVDRGKRLRAVVAETISDIGIVSLQTAEPKLLDLASAGDITTRRITAKAVARWRAFHKEEQMFQALTRWKEQKRAQVKATVVFTLQYAAEYDSPGFLEPRIMELLNSLSDDDTVLNAMKEILPRLLEHHLFQVKDDIVNHFAVHEKYNAVLTAAFVRSYSTHPHELKLMLESWLNNCLAESSNDNRRQKLTYRDNVLVLVLNVYRSIPYTNEADVIQLGYVWQILNTLHDKEQRRIMRAFVLETAAYLINVQPEMAIGYIEPIFRKTGLDERLRLIGAIGVLYLSQRAAQQGGDYTVSHLGYEIQLWNLKLRPLTPIEIILFRWLQGQHSFAREIATLAFMEFARILDYEEPLMIQKAIATGIEQERERAQRQARQAQMDQMETYVRYPVMPELSLWTRIKIFFWLIFSSDQEKIVLKELMRTLLMYKQVQPAYLQVIIRRWKAQQNNQVRRMAWWIEKITKF